MIFKAQHPIFEHLTLAIFPHLAGVSKTLSEFHHYPFI